MSQKLVEDLEEDGVFNPAEKIIEKAVDLWKGYSKLIIALIVIVLVVLMAKKSIDYKKSQAVVEASNKYSTALRIEVLAEKIIALESVFNDYSETPYAQYSAFTIAEEYLAVDSFSLANSWFEKVSESTDFIKSEVLEGQAVANEGLGNVDKAISQYKELLIIENNHRINGIRLKLASILISNKKAGAVDYCNDIITDAKAGVSMKADARKLLEIAKLSN